MYERFWNIQQEVWKESQSQPCGVIVRTGWALLKQPLQLGFISLSLATPCNMKCKHTVYINIPCRGQLVITQFSNFLLFWHSFIGEVSFVYVCVDVWKR